MNVIDALFDAILKGAVIFFGVTSVVLVACFIALLFAGLVILGVVMVW